MVRQADTVLWLLRREDKTALRCAHRLTLSRLLRLPAIELELLWYGPYNRQES